MLPPVSRIAFSSSWLLTHVADQGRQSRSLILVCPLRLLVGRPDYSDCAVLLGDVLNWPWRVVA